MPGREYTAQSVGGYRFGFNTQERDDEIYGKGNATTAEYWEYDTRLGRRWNVDPLTYDYPSQSPYLVFNNNPIYYSDPTGLAGEAPKDEKVLKTPSGGYMNVPANAVVEFFKESELSGKTVSNKDYQAEANSARAFTTDGTRYVANFKDGKFDGYHSTKDWNQKYSPEPILYEKKVSPEFKIKLLEVCYNIGHDPNKLIAVMAAETGETFKPDIWNGTTAVGLIQFTNSALNEINKQNKTSYTKESISKMTAENQLKVIEQYYKCPQLAKASFLTVEDYAVANFSPANVGKGSDNVIYKSPAKGYTSNDGMDKNNDRKITNGEVGDHVRKKYIKGK